MRAAACAPLFREVFGAGAFAEPDKAFARVAEAIAAFERRPVFSPFSSEPVALLAGHAHLTAQERRGVTLFEHGPAASRRR